jgi:hypothetical protein
MRQGLEINGRQKMKAGYVVDVGGRLDNRIWPEVAVGMITILLCKYSYLVGPGL